MSLPALKKFETPLPDEVMGAFCIGITRGIALETLFKTHGVSEHQYYWNLDTHPLFEKAVKDSRVRFSHSLIDKLIHATDGAETMADVQRVKVWSDNAKWVAGKTVPAIYGENINLSVTHHLDLSSVLLAAEGRVLPILATKSSTVPKSSLLYGADTKNSDAYTPRGGAIIDADVVEREPNAGQDAFKQSLESPMVAESLTDIPEDLKGLI